MGTIQISLRQNNPCISHGSLLFWIGIDIVALGAGSGYWHAYAARLGLRVTRWGGIDVEQNRRFGDYSISFRGGFSDGIGGLYRSVSFSSGRDGKSELDSCGIAGRSWLGRGDIGAQAALHGAGVVGCFES